MASTFILVGASALGTGLVSLICGYFWGRSNVRSQIEDALDKARISADAREYTVREALDEKMVEVAALRAQADEVPRLREQLDRLKLDSSRNAATTRLTAFATQINATEEIPDKQPEPAPVQESADKAIQNLLKSIEDRMNQGEGNAGAAGAPFPASAPSTASTFAAETPSAVMQPTARPAPVEAPAPKPAPVSVPAAKPAATAKPAPAPAKSAAASAKPAAAAAKDEWQEFAASLDALRNRQK